MKKKVALLVPAHNEEAVIESTLLSLLKFASAKDIYVVDDGSKDLTYTIAKKLTPNVLRLSPNQGKAEAMNLSIAHFKLTKKYQYLMPVDADTRVMPDFLDQILPIFESDKAGKIVAVVGKVMGQTKSWITTYRAWEYEIAQTIHKRAQAIENAIIVCPGCATVYRSSVFNQIKIPTGTLTEDMDFTYLIHRQNIGQITYCSKATVKTQDPDNLKDFLKQLDRWYTGFWQCLLKNNIPWGGHRLDAEVALQASEGVFNGLLCIIILFILPFALLKNPFIFAFPFLSDLFLFLLPSMAYTAFKYKSPKIFKYLIFFYFMRVISSLVFFKAFAKVVLGIDLSMTWGKAARYRIEEATG